MKPDIHIEIDPYEFYEWAMFTCAMVMMLCKTSGETYEEASVVFGDSLTNTVPKLSACDADSVPEFVPEDAWSVIKWANEMLRANK